LPPTGSTNNQGRVVFGGLLIVALLAAIVVAYVAVFIGGSIFYSLLPPIDTELTAEGQVSGAVATVGGTASMPDGAVLAYSVSSAADPYRSVDGTTTVHDGVFSFSADISSLSPGPTSAYLQFGIGWGVDQPPNVILVYGPGGERMTGDQVFSDSGDVLLEEVISLEPRGP
jgi:hypothetical protein